MFIVDDKVAWEGLAYTTTLRAPYSVLMQILGPPSKDKTEGTSTNWTLRDTTNTEHAVIKDTQPDDPLFKVANFRSLPSYDWEIQATNEAIGEKFCRWLSAIVIVKVREVKTLDEDAKNQLNALIAQGMSFTDALKQIPASTPENAAARFAWPITTPRPADPPPRPDRPFVPRGRRPSRR